MATLSVVTDSPPETGGSPRTKGRRPQGLKSRGRGWINLSPLTLPPCRGIEGGFLHARLNTKSGGQCREDCDYDIEDFAPGSIVIECSHSGKID